MMRLDYRINEDVNSLFSYSFDGNVMTFDPVSTGDAGWEQFLVAYNDFCSRHGARRCSIRATLSQDGKSRRPLGIASMFSGV